jgi:hypothetical protein
LKVSLPRFLSLGYDDPPFPHEDIVRSVSSGIERSNAPKWILSHPDKWHFAVLLAGSLAILGIFFHSLFLTPAFLLAGFNLCFCSCILTRHGLLRRRVFLLTSLIFLAALTVASMLPAEVEGQHNVVTTVTAYVTVVQTMLVQVPVTVYVTVPQMITSFLTFAKTDVSISVRLMTMWRTVTSVATHTGMLGPVPSNFFGSYSDLGLMGTGAITGAVAALTITKFLSHRLLPRTGEDPEPPPDSQGMQSFQGEVVEALNEQDKANQDLLDQVVTAANAISSGTSDVTVDDSKMKGKVSSLSGTGGVALLEYAKDKIQTAVSNISGMGTNEIRSRKVVERKMGDRNEGDDDDDKGEDDDDEANG